jgi:hypothetical protein
VNNPFLAWRRFTGPLSYRLRDNVDEAVAATAFASSPVLSAVWWLTSNPLYPDLTALAGWEDLAGGPPVDADGTAPVGTVPFLAPDRVWRTPNGGFDVRDVDTSVLVPCDPEVDAHATDSAGLPCFKAAGDLAPEWVEQVVTGAQVADAILCRGWVQGPDVPNARFRGSDVMRAMAVRALGSALLRLHRVDPANPAAGYSPLLARLPAFVNSTLSFHVVPDKFPLMRPGSGMGPRDPATDPDCYLFRLAQWALGAQDANAATPPTLEDLVLRVWSFRLVVAAWAAKLAGGPGAAPAPLEALAGLVRDAAVTQREATCHATQDVAASAAGFLRAEPLAARFAKYGLAPPVAADVDVDAATGAAVDPATFFSVCVPVYADPADAGAPNAKARVQGYTKMARLAVFAEAMVRIADDLGALVCEPAQGGQDAVLLRRDANPGSRAYAFLAALAHGAAPPRYGQPAP